MITGCYDQRGIGVFLKAIAEKDFSAIPALHDWLLDHNDSRWVSLKQLGRWRNGFFILDTGWIWDDPHSLLGFFGVHPCYRCCFLHRWYSGQHDYYDFKYKKFPKDSLTPKEHCECCLGTGWTHNEYIGNFIKTYPGPIDMCV